ncbi:MAG TPA: 16S rRNA (guanine(966)-N(2))-methyltransferase RsmD [Bacteroidota bacterium]|nr:16S rRNA (guanine(966)-N(2))-methyltransferase RsmD [Bacteroidota bacterium]
MRIIAGKYKGRILESPRDGDVRPATGRVKGTIFNMLQNRLNLIGASVLDLFAGSGSLGFEALSRGARSVTFVESTSSVLRTVEKNAAHLGCEDDCDFLRSPAEDYLLHAREKFDLIFADPPYAYTDTGRIPLQVFQKDLLKREGFLIIEHTKHVVFEVSELYEEVERRIFGSTIVTFLVHRTKNQQ